MEALIADPASYSLPFSFALQPVRFKLNHQSTRLMPGEKDHSVWVGDLTPDVDDLSLFKFFSARFQSVKSAKGTSDSCGGSMSSWHTWEKVSAM